MPKPDPEHRDSTLASIERGCSVRVASVEGRQSNLLATHGIHPGVTLSVEADAPFGGPRIVRVGRARVAVARLVARAVRVVPG